MIKIITDASSNLFPEILAQKKLDITVLPMQLALNGKQYQCYCEQVDAKKMSQAFYEEMLKGYKPKTSLVSPGLMEEAFLKELDKGNKVLYISMAKHISGNYQSAKIIADNINEERGESIYVIDSLTASFGLAMVAIYAYKLSLEKKELKGIAKMVEEYALRVRSEFTVNSIKYLANTGRVSSFSSTLASVLAIKPLLYGSEIGKIEVFSKVHGRLASLKALVNQVAQNITDCNSVVYIAHANSIDDATFVADKLLEVGINNVEIYFYDLITGAHVGPGTIAVFYEGNNRIVNKNSLIKTVLNKIKK